MKRMKMISNLSAGPLISKLRKSELARKRSSDSSMMSNSLGSDTLKIEIEKAFQVSCSCTLLFGHQYDRPVGAGPRNFDLIGSIATLPTIRTSASSLKDEW